MFTVKVIVNITKVKCLSGWYLLNCSIFSGQTWHCICSASLWGEVLCRKVGFYLQGPGLSEGLHNQNNYDCFANIFLSYSSILFLVQVVS